ncbi:MAG: hypothetical protein M0D57_19860 [Sphingobacteriales bacterium JAD_PAG50586_3]|nr:MAG: hypothetical protein M0D57_19860 [Sphingobacteriales bacterium JAD_PAG50586_3]
MLPFAVKIIKSGTFKYNITNVMSPRDFINKQWVQRTLYFFPLQLIWVHISRNHIMLLYWFLLFGYVTNSLGRDYGVPYLFLDPEYMGQVNFWSYFIMGLACGGFIMAFHITTYITDCRKFSFIATLSNPFYKFSVNNSLLPMVFIVVHAYSMFMFRYKNEFGSNGENLLFIASYLFGIFVFISITMTYFFSTNKDISHISKNHYKDGKKHIAHLKVRRLHLKSDMKWKGDTYKTEADWNVETYLIHPYRMALARDTDHYERTVLLKVFRQNHNSAFIFTLLLFASLIVFGAYRENKYLMIPAGACIFMMVTMLVMISGALYAFFRKWTSTVVIALAILVNALSGFDFFRTKNYAYGLEYTKEQALYSGDSLFTHSAKQKIYNDDKRETIKILERWVGKYDTTGNKKPRLVIMNASGGGLKAALWTFYSMQVADSITNGQLLKNTVFNTGSSGGMFGLAYLRELYLRKQRNELANIYSPKYVDNMGKDLLNPMAVSIAFNDMFIRLQKFTYNGHSYTKDRGYSFEEQLIKNTEGMLNRSLKDYTIPEQQAIIPMMAMSPTIINDGRRLLISSQPMSYLTDNSSKNNVTNANVIEDIEFLRFFQKQGAENLRFTTALRMGATFPYILPSVSMPTYPEMRVMDAGLRDNYGLKTTLRFIYTFRDWIRANTSGVVIVQTREAKIENGKPFEIKQSLFETISGPVGNVYTNIFKTQDYTLDELLSYSSEWADMPLDVINFELSDAKTERVSLSFHLTSLEKARVKNAWMLPENQASLKRLLELLK